MQKIEVYFITEINDFLKEQDTEMKRGNEYWEMIDAKATGNGDILVELELIEAEFIKESDPVWGLGRVGERHVFGTREKFINWLTNEVKHIIDPGTKEERIYNLIIELDNQITASKDKCDRMSKKDAMHELVKVLLESFFVGNVFSSGQSKYTVEFWYGE